jgi:hypothetical protein
MTKWNNCSCTIFLTKFLFSDEGKYIKDTQPVEGQVEELRQLSPCKQGIAIIHNIIS